MVEQYKIKKNIFITSIITFILFLLLFFILFIHFLIKYNNLNEKAKLPLVHFSAVFDNLNKYVIGKIYNDANKKINYNKLNEIFSETIETIKKRMPIEQYQEISSLEYKKRQERLKSVTYNIIGNEGPLLIKHNKSSADEDDGKFWEESHTYEIFSDLIPFKGSYGSFTASNGTLPEEDQIYESQVTPLLSVLLEAREEISSKRTFSIQLNLQPRTQEERFFSVGMNCEKDSLKIEYKKLNEWINENDDYFSKQAYYLINEVGIPKEEIFFSMHLVASTEHTSIAGNKGEHVTIEGMEDFEWTNPLTDINNAFENEMNFHRFKGTIWIDGFFSSVGKVASSALTHNALTTSPGTLVLQGAAYASKAIVGEEKTCKMCWKDIIKPALKVGVKKLAKQVKKEGLLVAAGLSGYIATFCAWVFGEVQILVIPAIAVGHIEFEAFPVTLAMGCVVAIEALVQKLIGLASAAVKNFDVEPYAKSICETKSLGGFCDS